MEFFKSNTTPVYKNAGIARVVARPAATNGLSGLLGSLLGSATPVYKTADGQTASFSSSGLLSMFAVKPSYKTATPVTVAEAPLDGDDLAEVAEVADVAELADVAEAAEVSEPDDESAGCELVPHTIVLL